MWADDSGEWNPRWMEFINLLGGRQEPSKTQRHEKGRRGEERRARAREVAWRRRRRRRRVRREGWWWRRWEGSPPSLDASIATLSSSSYPTRSPFVVVVVVFFLLVFFDLNPIFFSSSFFSHHAPRWVICDLNRRSPPPNSTPCGSTLSLTAAALSRYVSIIVHFSTPNFWYARWRF